MSAAFSYGPQTTGRLASSVREWSVPYTLGSAGTTIWPLPLAPVILETEEQESGDLIKTQALEQIIEQARWQWQDYAPPEPEIDVEQDIWVQLPPKREFTVTLNILFQGRGAPDPLPEELLGNEA